MKPPSFLLMILCTLVTIIGCRTPSVPGSPGVPEPIKVLENTTTGERVRFFREIPFKIPKDYDEEKQISEWTATHEKNGFTKEITPEDDREQLAELRRKNLATARQQQLAD